MSNTKNTPETEKAVHVETPEPPAKPKTPKEWVASLEAQLKQLEAQTNQVAGALSLAREMVKAESE